MVIFCQYQPGNCAENTLSLTSSCVSSKLCHVTDQDYSRAWPSNLYWIILSRDFKMNFDNARETRSCALSVHVQITNRNQ